MTLAHLNLRGAAPPEAHATFGKERTLPEFEKKKGVGQLAREVQVRRYTVGLPLLILPEIQWPIALNAETPRPPNGLQEFSFASTAE